MSDDRYTRFKEISQSIQSLKDEGQEIISGLRCERNTALEFGLLNHVRQMDADLEHFLTREGKQV